MNKLVIKKLIFQLLLIFLLTFVPIQIFNRVLGPSNITWIGAEAASNISKDIVLIQEANRLDLSKARSIISTLNGYNIFETDGYLQAFKLTESVYILINTKNTTEISHIYTLDVTDFKTKEVTSKFKLPNIPNLTLGNIQYISNNLCFWYKENSYLFDCYEYKDKEIKRIDMSEVNNKISQIKSNKYYVEKTFEANQIYMLIYMDDQSEFSQDPLLSFRIIDGRIIISEDNLGRHIIDNNDFPSLEFNNIYTSPVFSFTSYRVGKVLSSGYVLKRYGFQDESQMDYNNELNPIISNPIIGEQYIEHKGVKYMSWLSTYDFNQIHAGIIGNITIFVRINNSLYFIDKTTKKVYKLNTKKDFESGTPIDIVYL